MDALIVPEPPADEREAIAAALVELAAREREHELGRSAWWRAGIAEGVAADEP